MQVAIRDQQVVRKKAVYVAIGVTLEGERDCLGLWIEKTEGARFWTSLLTELRNRGVTDVLFVCTDGLSGFPEAIDAVFPQAVNQTCIVHLVRQSLRYLSWRERKRCAGELRRIYTAADADQARQVLDELTAAWSASKTRTAALQVWDRAWERVIPFLAFPAEIRRIVYTTDESVKGAVGAVGARDADFGRWTSRGECSQGLRAAPAASIFRRSAVSGQPRPSRCRDRSGDRCLEVARRALGWVVGAGDPGPKRGALGMEAPPRRIAA